ncbi:MAG: putative tricarboxylic transport rane protein [Petroclostridium sp.]|nr:putative tricarboxylic transport rane protein [Petroclostridium sp.]
MNTGSITGIVTIAFGVVYSILAYNMERSSIGNPLEPMMFPLILGICMIICGILLFVGEVRKKEQKKVEKDSAKKGLSYDTKLIIYTCAVSLIYAFLFEEIGYVLSTTLFMCAMLFALNGKEQWKTNIAVALGFSIGVYIVFMKFLSIPLPMMPF